MKILHVIPSVSPIYGGPSLAVKAMTSSLVKAGLEVDIATTTANGTTEMNVPLASPVIETGVRYHYFPRSLPRQWSFSPLLARWLYENVRNYDLLHIHALFSYTTLPACHFARKSGVPYVLRPLGTLSPWSLSQKKLRKKIYYSLFEKKNLLSASAVHATSEFEARDLKILGVREKVHIIPLGIKEMPLPERKASQNGVPRLLFLSRLNAEKGLPLLLQSMASLVETGICPCLTVAGSGDPAYLSQIRDEVGRLKLSSQVEFMGFVEGEKKTQLFADSDIFVLPSNHENFGLAAAEAMAAGLPVVVSDQVGVSPEILKFGAGIVVERNSRSLTQGLTKLISDPSLRKKMGEQGKKLVQERFSWDKVGEELAKLYKKILSENSCR